MTAWEELLIGAALLAVLAAPWRMEQYLNSYQSSC